MDKVDYKGESIVKNRKVGAVILNYNSGEDTVNCCESLLEQKGVQIFIIIVDNKSTDNSEQLINDYIKKKNVSNLFFVKNQDNLGFAKGNNVGIVYARKSLKCDYVFVLNSDCLIEDKKAVSKMLNRDAGKVGIISPECYGFDRKTFQLPYCISNGNYIKEVINTILLVIWQSFKACINKNWSIHKNLSPEFDYKKYRYIIQGNAYILTPTFFEHYDCLYPKTFLYLEETALLWYMKKANLNTIYTKESVVLHKEAGSNKELVSTKEIKKAREMRRSLIAIFPICFMKENKIVEKFSYEKY